MKGNFNINEKMASAPNDAFRARAVHQAKTVINTVSPHAALDAAKVLDFGCGQGIALASLALRYPESHFFGADILPIDQPYLSSELRVIFRRP